MNHLNKHFFTEYDNQHHTFKVGKLKNTQKTKKLPSKIQDSVKMLSELNVDGTYFNLIT